MHNLNIIASRVDLVDDKGTITTPWYRFLNGLWQLVGAGGNTMSIADLTVTPPAVTVEQVAELRKVVQGLQEAPSASGLREQVAVLMKASAAVPVIDYGSASTNGGGNATVTFAKTFTIAPSVTVSCTSTALEYVANTNGPTTTQVGVTTWQGGATAGGIGFNWIAVGV